MFVARHILTSSRGVIVKRGLSVGGSHGVEEVREETGKSEEKEDSFFEEVPKKELLKEEKRTSDANGVD